jgi:hypothetical protein
LIVFVVEHLGQLSFGFFNGLAFIVKGHDYLIISKEIGQFFIFLNIFDAILLFQEFLLTILVDLYLNCFLLNVLSLGSSESRCSVWTGWLRLKADKLGWFGRILLRFASRYFIVEVDGLTGALSIIKAWYVNLKFRKGSLKALDALPIIFIELWVLFIFINLHNNSIGKQVILWLIFGRIDLCKMVKLFVQWAVLSLFINQVANLINGEVNFFGCKGVHILWD